MPRAQTGSGLTTGNMFMVVLVAIMGLYLWSQFTEEVNCTVADIADDNRHGCTAISDTYTDIGVPDDVDKTTFTLIRLLIIGVAIFVGYSVVLRVTGNRLMSKRDIMSLIVLGIVVVIVWTYIIGPNGFDLLNTVSFDDLTYKSVKKLGLG